MVVQGIAPSLFGAFSDTYGRRFTFTVSLVIYTVANLALAFTSSFPMLLVLRGVQAAGSAATISISAGVIADIANPRERGGFMGTNAGIRMTGQAIGPVIGGVLNSTWGFRSLFWLLDATQGRGQWQHSLVRFPQAFDLRGQSPKAWGENTEKPLPQHRGSVSLKKAFSPLGYIFEKDIAILLAWGAVAYTAWSMVTSSTTTALLKGFTYLNEWQIGLCFLPNGFGCVAGSLCTGWLLDKSFKGAEARYRAEHGINDEQEDVSKKSGFPLVRARLRLMPYFSLALLFSLALYGPSFEFNDLRRQFSPNLAAPLGLQFLIAFTATAIFNIDSTLLVDCFPDRPASATALNNLCRCLLGAAGVSVIQPMIDGVKIMKAFFIVTGILLTCTPLVWVEWKWGESGKRSLVAVFYGIGF
ncbi:hypothetical protein CEP53_001386 [Fusarium sp. AF-6]|nr:hypothetical protein CEP53_001386 [Fusarium sp. AF-6]